MSFVISSSVVVVALNAIASNGEVKDKHLTGIEISAEMSDMLKNYDTSKVLANNSDALVDALFSDSEAVDVKKLLAYSDDSTTMRPGDPFTVERRTATAREMGEANRSIRCYSNCYSNCHGACHGSRGWR